MNDPIKNCEENNHRINKVECWINGKHAYGTIQCGTCGTKSKYDILFPVSNKNMEKIYKEKFGKGEWRTVNSENDLVFEFEEKDPEPVLTCNDKDVLQLRNPDKKKNFNKFKKMLAFFKLLR